MKVAALLLALATTAQAGQPRSAAVVREWRQANPCPSTGQVRGPCPGWQVDHRDALVCGGADHPSNLQWLAIEPHKAKSRVEVKLCRTHRR